jgi:hypothetical protein
MFLYEKEWITACLVMLSLTGCQDGSNDFLIESIGETGEVNKIQIAESVTGVDLDVKLEKIAAFQPEITETKRNPFRFGQPWEPVNQIPDLLPQQETSFTTRLLESNDTDESFRSLRYIGLVDASTSIGKIAVVSDGKVVFHGRCGDVLDGRFRVLSISLNQLEVESLVDGDRQTLFLNSVSQ